jgi:hypothetical protein
MFHSFRFLLKVVINIDHIFVSIVQKETLSNDKQIQALHVLYSIQQLG